jgi:hypothetical protein
MSHVVTVQTQIRDLAVLQAACRRLQLAEPQQATAKLFSSEATGQVLQLPGWRYPVIFDLAQGHVNFDNYGGRWGKQRQLDAVFQAYAAEQVTLQARRQGHSICEQALDDGSIKLTIQVGAMS